MTLSFLACMLSRFSCVPLFKTIWTVAHQASLSMGLSRQEYWSGFPCPFPRDLPDPGIELFTLRSFALAGEYFTTSATWEALFCFYNILKKWILYSHFRNEKKMFKVFPTLYLKLINDEALAWVKMKLHLIPGLLDPKIRVLIMGNWFFRDRDSCVLNSETVQVLTNNRFICIRN